VFITISYLVRVHLSTVVCGHMLIAFKSRSAIDKLKKNWFFEFEIMDIDKTKKVLGMEIERDRKKDSSTHKGYLKKIFLTSMMTRSLLVYHWLLI